ncbi:MAG: hypothetical protein HZB26_22090 [Candidatus Hydrogenedentes bacterium]|nr:hypothetical protein [Candidatus Hydrogenedentota bacterium]
MINPIDRLQALRGPLTPEISASRSATTGAAFGQVFANELRERGQVRFSAHAAQRLQDRNLQLTASDQARIAGAVDTAASKGSRETLLLTDRMALVVSVPNRTVITVVPTNDLKNTVFTNIDSAIVVPGDAQAPRAANG